MIAALYTIFVLNSFFLIMVVLLQAGRGGGLSFAGGGGATQMVGAGSGAPLLQKLTAGSAAAFMILSMVLANLSTTHDPAEAGSYDDEPAAGAVEGSAGE